MLNLWQGIVKKNDVRESGFPNPGSFCLWNPKSGKTLLVKYEILGFGIRNTAHRTPESHKRLESRIQAPLTKNRIHYLEYRIHGMESRIQFCLGFPYMERKKNKTTTTNAIKPLSLLTKSCTTNSLKYMLCKLFIYFFQWLNVNFWI